MGLLKYLIGDAMYGGRVADNFDRRVLQTYMHEYMGDFLDKAKPFFFSQVGFDYKLPPDKNVAVYQKAVEELPSRQPGRVRTAPQRRDCLVNATGA